MRDLNQLLLDFEQKKNFNEHDYYVSKSNYFAFNIVDKWPKWEKRILNICGEKFSGKTHLSNIFLGKNKGFKINENEMNDDWDGDWKQATTVQEDGWTSEILIPWSIAPMKSVSTEEREIGICFYRLIISEFRVFATCRGSPYQEKFLSIFPKIKVKKYMRLKKD